MRSSFGPRRRSADILSAVSQACSLRSLRRYRSLGQKTTPRVAEFQAWDRHPAARAERRALPGRVLAGCWLLLCLITPTEIRAAEAVCSNDLSVVVVIGAAGEAEYGSNFLHEAALWKKACTTAGARYLEIGQSAGKPEDDCSQLEKALKGEPKDVAEQLWLVLIGHGSFDGKEARFNLRGPDISATELAEWLSPFHRPLAIVAAASSSAPFLNKLSGTNRVVITATKSGYEQNYTRFGRYFAEVLCDPGGDLDKDGQVSLLEAFLVASRRASEFYKTEGRLVTEHALIDDNGDALGTPADWFQGLRAVKKTKDNAGLDGLLAARFCLVPSEIERRLPPSLRAQRDLLERKISALRDRKQALAEDEYYRGLELLLLELARFYATNSATPAN